jgi:haloalkane dehalogenase
LPGHGLSDRWQNGANAGWPVWQEVLTETGRQLGAKCAHIPAPPAGDPDRLYPDLSPDRFGAYLIKAWCIVRARRCFSPWYEANSGHVIELDVRRLTPEALAQDHRALIRATDAKSYHLALLEKEGKNHGNS